MTAPARQKKKRRVSKVALYWWLAPVAAGLGVLLWAIAGPDGSLPRIGRNSGSGPLSGYVSSFATVAQEYRRFHGKDLAVPGLSERFAQATRHMEQQDYGMAAQLLQEISRTAAVPAVFNNLGLVYLAQHDRSAAIHAFREALSRDNNYQQVRQNMERSMPLGLETAMPLNHEVEPNSTLMLANVIAGDKPVDGEIEAGADDVDSYRITTPPAPRDSVRIEVRPQSRTLEPMIRIFDSEHRLLAWIKGKDAPGKPISTTMAPPPNTPLYLQVSGLADTAGLYTLKVTPLKAYDAYEPNNDIFNARPIQVGSTLDANILDKSDTDYYSFEPERTGRIKVSIRNRSATLIPALSTFHPNMRSSGFGPDVRTPGANLEHSFDVETNRKYYIQVWSQADSSGAYSLKVEW